MGDSLLRKYAVAQETRFRRLGRQVGRALTQTTCAAVAGRFGGGRVAALVASELCGQGFDVLFPQQGFLPPGQRPPITKAQVPNVPTGQPPPLVISQPPSIPTPPQPPPTIPTQPVVPPVGQPTVPSGGQSPPPLVSQPPSVPTGQPAVPPTEQGPSPGGGQPFGLPAGATQVLRYGGSILYFLPGQGYFSIIGPEGPPFTIGIGAPTGGGGGAPAVVVGGGGPGPGVGSVGVGAGAGFGFCVGYLARTHNGRWNPRPFDSQQKLLRR